MFSALEIAQYIIDKCCKEDRPVSNLQLQKILSYIQRDFLKRDNILFKDEIQAWQFGPVVPKVYYQYCGFGAMPICMLYNVSLNSLDSYNKQLMDSIIEEQRDKDPWQLVEETHRPNGAWATIYQDGNGNKKTIPVNLIKRIG